MMTFARFLLEEIGVWVWGRVCYCGVPKWTSVVAPFEKVIVYSISTIGRANVQVYVVRPGPSGAIGEAAAEHVPVTTAPPAASASTETLVTGFAMVLSP